MYIFIDSLKELNNKDVVYFYMREGQCLYVGVTKNIQQRYHSHCKDEYSKQSDRIVIYTYENYIDAALAEIYYINIKYPPFNSKDKIDNGYIYANKHKEYFDKMHKKEYCFMKKEKCELIQKQEEEEKQQENKQKKKHKKEPIYQIDPYDNKILNCFNTQKEALMFIDKLGHSGISDALNERDGIKTHYAYGYRWYYKSDLPF